MKTKFGYYYGLSPKRDSEFKASCKYVLDTNVLLDILRLGKDLADKALKTLEDNKDRIVIPYYVGKEYHKHFIEEVKKQYDAHDKACKKMSLDAVDSSILNLMDKVRFSESEHNEIKNNFKEAVDKLINLLKARTKYYQELLKSNSLQDKVASILDGCVLNAFRADEIIRIETEGKERYENKMPPGFEDSNKRDNKYGDLIIWREILRYAQKESVDICFVSRDLKKDWHEILNGERICPRYEIQEEFQRAVPTKHFKIISLYKFLELIDRTSYTEQQLKEIEQITEQEDSEYLKAEKVSKDGDIEDKELKEPVSAMAAETLPSEKIKDEQDEE